MRLAVTRPLADSERTADALRARGHEVLVAPLMRVEPITADLSGGWGALIITSANAAGAIADNPARAGLVTRPLFAVGRRSADTARAAGFVDIASAGGDVRDLVRLVVGGRADAKAPLLYLAGEERAVDLVSELTARGLAVEMRIVYRAVTTPFPSELIDALKAGEIDAVLHFSRRSAENYVSGAAQAGIAGPALGPRHFCLSAQIAEPLAAAGASHITVARHANETAMIELADKPQRT
jgi:uroporphyrinogen-III synthase